MILETAVDSSVFARFVKNVLPTLVLLRVDLDPDYKASLAKDPKRDPKYPGITWEVVSVHEAQYNPKTGQMRIVLDIAERVCCDRPDDGCSDSRRTINDPVPQHVFTVPRRILIALIDALEIFPETGRTSGK